MTGIVPSAFSLSFYNSSLMGNPGLCSNDGLEGLKSCSDMEDGRRRKCKKRNDTLMTYYHKNIPNLLRWSVLIDVLLIYKITAIGPLHILKYPVKQLLRYYQAILTKISRATFQGIKICPDSAIDYEYQGSIQASTESKPTRMKSKNYTRTKRHQNITETTLYYNLNLLR